ncbi:hypothetical protein HDV06_001108 [Boothiomyces sp. JEL0866]|nr:hypothetical protein HDV06_001108 [Boothiomyces sp. JEL0866]
MTFSSAVVLTDLNDFISPSQACIKPVDTPKPTTDSAQVKIDKDGSYYQVQIDGSEQKLESATISLNDCLACSGCITSAESVLITQQSYEEFYKVLKQNAENRQNGLVDGIQIICVSISSQSRASIGAKYGLSADEVWHKLSQIMTRKFGVDHVFDVDFARDLALLESGKSFVARYTNQGELPMLASSCPGWICYAEKTHGTILNLIDTTKSPQQIMGSLLKDYFAQQIGVSPDKIYHVSIMPCYDKKLEASRQDFYSDLYRTRDVDLVLATSEVELMIQQEQITFNDIPLVPYNSMFTKNNGSELGKTEGSSSGGYLSFIMRYAVYTLYNINISPEDVEFGRNGISVIQGRNSDFTEVFYTPPNHAEPSLKFAYAYGFRNIQNLVRKVKSKSKRSAIKYDFVEVMACPSGCINGGGQLKNESLPSKEWVALQEAVYQNGKERLLTAPELSPVVQLYQEWLGGEGSAKAQQMLHTSYHAVENNFQSGLAVKW